MNHEIETTDLMPRGFKLAALRGVTAVNRLTGKEIGVSFDQPDGETIRLILDVEDARNLAQSLQGYLALYRRSNGTNCHSDSASGNPSVEVSSHCE